MAFSRCCNVIADFELQNTAYMYVKRFLKSYSTGIDVDASRSKLAL